MGRTIEPGLCLKTRGGEGYRGEAQSETGTEALCRERRETGREGEERPECRR